MERLGKTQSWLKSRGVWHRSHAILWVVCIGGLIIISNSDAMPRLLAVGMFVLISLMAVALTWAYGASLTRWLNWFGVRVRHRFGWDPVESEGEPELAEKPHAGTLAVGAFELMGWGLLFGILFRLSTLRLGWLTIAADPTGLSATIPVIAGGALGIALVMPFWAAITTPGWSGTRWRNKERKIADPLKGFILLRLAGPLTGVAILGRISNELSYPTWGLQYTMQALIVAYGILFIYVIAQLAVLLYVHLLLKPRARAFRAWLKPTRVRCEFIELPGSESGAREVTAPQGEPGGRQNPGS